MTAKTFIKFSILLFVVAFCFAKEAAAQKNSVEFFARLFFPFDKNGCTEFQPGKVVLIKRPDFPEKAKNRTTGGIVEYRFDVSETGIVSNPLKLSGHPFFEETTLESASKIRFSPTLCDGKPQKVSASLIYVFLVEGGLDSYFIPTRIEDYSDISEVSQFYEPVLFLTENYNLTFGFSDKKFHPELPLTYGDFAYFLDSTLKLITERAKIAGKDPTEINLFSSFNPQNLVSADKIAELNRKKPYAAAVKNLLQTYKIAVVDKNNAFYGEVPLTNVEVIKYWRKIFGNESVPVNFQNTGNTERLMTRGEFALFLRESLEVLMYKVMP